MVANTKIEWADHTFNPWIGCTEVSPACDHCYAKNRMDTRLHKVEWGAGNPRERTTDKNWNMPLKWNSEAERLGIRYRVFCASLADVFDNEVPNKWRADLLELIDKTPHLDWLLLTKRVGNVERMLMDALHTNFLRTNQEPKPWPWKNVWLGITVCNQEESDRDIPKLLELPARVRFLSIEPLLGPIDLTKISPNLFAASANALTGIWKWEKGPRRRESDAIDWVIVGGESGHNARPMHPDWVMSLQSQCKLEGVPFMFKQWGAWVPHVRPDEKYIPPKGQYAEWCGTTKKWLFTKSPSGHNVEMRKVGKKKSGRMLDGQVHDESPFS